MLVKSLTKKNCKEIGAEYIGRDRRLKGVNYSYRGIRFNQIVFRGEGVQIDFIYNGIFNSYGASCFFRHSCKDNGSLFYKGEVSLSDLKVWMDKVADAVESANAKAQSPISEEERSQLFLDVKKVEDKADQIISQVQKDYHWTESVSDTMAVITKCKSIDSRVKGAKRELAQFLLEEQVKGQRDIQSVVLLYLDEILEQISALERLSSKRI